MFHSLLVINSSSREIAVPTDEKEEKKEEKKEEEKEEEEEEEEKIKSKNKRKVVLVTKIFTLQTRVRSILTDSLLQRSRRRRRSQWSGSRSQWRTSRHSPPVLACSSTCPIQAERSPFLLLAAESP